MNEMTKAICKKMGIRFGSESGCTYSLVDDEENLFYCDIVPPDFRTSPQFADLLLRKIFAENPNMVVKIDVINQIENPPRYIIEAWTTKKYFLTPPNADKLLSSALCELFCEVYSIKYEPLE